MALRWSYCQTIQTYHICTSVSFLPYSQIEFSNLLGSLGGGGMSDGVSDSVSEWERERVNVGRVAKVANVVTILFLFGNYSN